jgi:hypothetical protein
MTARAALRARLVRDDLQQPGSERRAAAEAAERPVGLQERLLERVLRVARIASDQVRHPIGEALVLEQQRLVGIDVPALRPLDELLLPPARRCGLGLPVRKCRLVR